jgi:TolA-binding protein
MTKKLDKEHLEAIQDLQQRFAQNASWIGSVSIELKMLERQTAQTESQHEELLRQFDALREEEQKLVESLKERYGDGEINIAQGTFTPTV